MKADNFDRYDQLTPEDYEASLYQAEIEDAELFGDDDDDDIPGVVPAVLWTVLLVGLVVALGVAYTGTQVLALVGERLR